MNPYLAMLKTSDNTPAVPLTVLTKAPCVSTVSTLSKGMGEASISPEAVQHDPSVSKVSSPNRGIRQFLPPGLLTRIMALVAAGRLSEGQGDEMCDRYLTNPDLWESKLVASERATGLMACHGCGHYRTPGLTGPFNGHCAGRDDLPPAYGAHHPLRTLPKDGGHSCREFWKESR